MPWLYQADEVSLFFHVIIQKWWYIKPDYTNVSLFHRAATSHLPRQCLMRPHHHHPVFTPLPLHPSLCWLSIAHFPFLPLFSKSPSTFACELLVYLLLYDAPTTLAFEKERGGELPQPPLPPHHLQHTHTHHQLPPKKKQDVTLTPLPGLA